MSRHKMAAQFCDRVLGVCLMIAVCLAVSELAPAVGRGLVRLVVKR